MEKEKDLEFFTTKTDKKGMKESLKITKLVALVLLIFKMELDMKERPKMVREMGGEKLFIQTVIVMKENIKMRRKMKWEFTNGLMGAGKKVTIKSIKLMVKHFHAVQMGEQ